MNAVDHETDNRIKQQAMIVWKIRQQKLEKSERQIEIPDYTEHKIKIVEMKQNIILKKLSKMYWAYLRKINDAKIT